MEINECLNGGRAMDDSKILEAILNRSDIGIDDLISKYGKLIYGVINKTMFNDYHKSEVDELFNQVIFKLWNNLDCFDESKGKLSNFIISVARFTTIDYVRKVKNYSNNIEIIDNIIEVGSYEDQYREVNSKEEFMELIEPLKELDKDIFIRRYYFGEEVHQIAEVLKVTPNYISNRISRGKQLLKKSLNNYAG